MKFDFMEITAKVMAEVRTRTCIDYVDAEVLEELLKDKLIKYRNEVFTYGHNIGYDDGYTAGNNIGYDDGYAAGKSSLEGDIDNAYDEGYALGYSEGHSEVKTLLRMR